ncbi:hypothetical protein [Anaerophilus nitritogenes]|uniref:hypothetical protein n=1 Tax=Anaerophilus nitritogenes TaxID=2498136 RepID=UPI00101C9694|nr:hypothetical protein [Anaerophilus nitritogenes]
MKEFKSLKILDKVSFFFEKLGINYPVMRKIIQIKLIMDTRRVSTFSNNTDKKKDKDYFKQSLWVYGMFGVVIMFMMISSNPLFIKLNLSFGMIMFMLMMVMIADFSSVLLDIKDKMILLTKPIDEKTMNVAKMVHISIYLFIITITIAGPSCIAGTIKHGLLFSILFLVELVWIAGFMIFITALFYFFILKLFDGEKLKDMINYFQIMLSIIMTIGYQFVGRMFDILDAHMMFTPKWWNYLIPTAWFSAPFEVLLFHRYESFYIILSIMSIIIPSICVMIYIKKVVPYFEKNLLKLNGAGSKNKKRKSMINRLDAQIGKIFCKDSSERALFKFTQTMIINERQLKLKIYPSITFAVACPFIILFRSFNSLHKIRKEIYEDKLYLVLYLSIQMLCSIYIYIQNSENHRGAWVYDVLPVKNLSVIYKGAWKGFVIKYNIATFIIPSSFFIMICGKRIFPEVIIMFLNMLILDLLIFKISSKDLPFSQDFSHIQNNKLDILLISLGFIGFSVVMHIFLRDISYALLIYGCILLAIFFYLFKRVFKIEYKEQNSM